MSTDHNDVRQAWREAIHEEPPAHLDAAIRAAARRAVGARPVSIHRPWTRRFGPPLAAAAVVVLSVSVIFVGVQERPDEVPPTLRAALEAPKEARKVMAEGEPAKSSAEVPARIAATPEPALSSAPPASSPAPPAISDKQAALQASAGAVVAEERKSIAEKAEVIVQQKLDAAANRLGTSSMDAVQQAPATFAKVKEETAVADAVPDRERMVTVEASKRSMPASPRPSWVAPRPAPPTAEPTPGQNAEARKERSNVGLLSPAPTKKDADPQAWLQRIDKLFLEGKRDEARKELESFVLAWPRHELPAPLAALLKE